MTNKFLKVKMEPTKSGIGGSFITTASFKLDNIISPFHNISVKIDTGCSISTVPLAKFQILHSFCDYLKEKDIAQNVPYQISYGIETSGKKHLIPRTFEEKMNCEALKFEHSVTGFELGGIPFSQDKLYINYNRSGSILIGMDILKKWEIHIGESVIDGNVWLIGCPKEHAGTDYLDELIRQFGY